MKKFSLTLAIAVILAIVGYGGYTLYRNMAFAPTVQENVIDTPLPENGKAESGVDEVEALAPTIEIIAENLQIPWEVVFLPSGDPEEEQAPYGAGMLVTERTGSLVKIGADPSTSSGRVRTKISIEGVEHIGEGGLLGLALHPNFEENNWIYLYLTTRADGGLINRIERYRLVGNTLSQKTIIIDNIPGARFHDGGRIAFSPDGFLYITTGDAGDSQSAQNLNSLAGKILRLNDDGTIPSNNPFETAIYSYGHRNPQGLAWDASGQLWATEHGRSGVLSGLDELNKIIKGENYGWPDSQGDAVLSGTVGPIIHSGPNITWAPASAAFWDGSIFFGGLRGESLYEAIIHNGTVTELKTHFHREFGRIRTVQLGPDGMLYLTTSNTDGRGAVRAGDDKIIRVNPEIFR